MVRPALLAAATMALAAATAIATADTTLVTNVNGYTLVAGESGEAGDAGVGERQASPAERELRRFAALQFTGDTIDRVFAVGEELPTAGEGWRTVDGGGATLLPGLIDAHGHVLSYGLSLLQVDLTGADSEAEAARRVREFAAAQPDSAWIQGRGWNQVLWEGQAFPTAATLADIERPVWLARVDGHAGWANAAALAIAGITAATPGPAGGQIIRDGDGNPTGVLVDNAMGLLRDHIPPLNDAERQAALLAALRRLASFGLTGVHDAGIAGATARAYQELVAAAPLPIRVNAMLAASDPRYESLLAAGHVRSADDTLAIHSVKIVADGALGSRGAALLADYADAPGQRGLLIHSAERLELLMRAAMTAGFQVNTHAIGDNANMLTLDTYERLIGETASRDRRHRVEHAQVLRVEDIERFAALGVLPSVQATHATSDKNMAEDRLGATRIHGAYAWRKLLEAGAVIANGSDFPVESPNPFFGLHAAVTRQDHAGELPGGWYPQEALTLTEALASFTLDAAYAGHQEQLLGSLEAGKKADFIFIDRDPFDMPASELWTLQVLATWVGGTRVYP